ncbi:MAG: phage Gp37/Gp68 family protein [Alphaproteobacteria bacterium]|nr:phage Gp37/Gp68 family protein [Alphaproteobacteria bacterium]MCK5658766.1 phage Gp37/Gp68 family protein [Alphaproteobacteria bacterium]
MAQSSIEWTEQTWNPVTGCTKISSGCKFCYAEKFAKRLEAMGVENYRNGFKLTLHPHMLTKPLEWKKPSIIFVNSMSDLFHEDVPEEFIMSVFKTMNEAYWHQFQVLTKRPERVLKMNKKLNWMPNIWMGTSVENKDCVSRIDSLRKTSAKIKFLSLEPLLGALENLNLKKIDWVIVGGESGFKARPMEPEWVIDIQKQCENANLSFFFKQWGGKNKKKTGRLLKGKTWDEMPQHEIVA